MLFAYLTAHDIQVKGRRVRALDARPDPNINGIAVTKARTFLSYLHDNTLLEQREHSSGWTLFCRADNSLLHSQPLAPEAVTDDVLAVVPLRDQLAVWDQPGVMLVRNTLEANMLTKEWLFSSRRWLDKNPRKRDEIAQHVAA